MLGDAIGNLFGAKREVVKSFEAAMKNFRETLADLRDVVSHEKELIEALEVEKAEIDNQIVSAEKEMKSCEHAINSINNLFPGLEG